MCDRPRDTELLSLDQLHKTPSSACGDLPLCRAVEVDEVITEAIRLFNPQAATRRGSSEGVLAGVSQTAVYDTC